MEDVVLMEELRYKSIAQSHSDFRQLVLTRMRMEAEMIQTDLKPLYLDEADLCNSMIPTDHGGEFSPIHVSSIVVYSAPQDKLDDEWGDAGVEDQRDVTIMMTPQEIEQIIFVHSREAIIDFNTKVDELRVRLYKQLVLKEKSVI